MTPRGDSQGGSARVDRKAVLISGAYLLVAVAWITGLDWLAEQLAGDDVAVYAQLQRFKGILFVTTMAVGLYAAIAWANMRERRRAAAQRELEEMLLVSQRLEGLGTLASSVVHDFGNVITVIRGTTTLIQLEGACSPEVADRLAQIDQAANQANQLVRQLMLFIRHAPLTFEAIDLGAVVREEAELFQRAAGRGVTVTVEVAEGLPEVQGVRAQLESSLLNLVVNARDALDGVADKRIGVRVEVRALAHYRSRFHPDKVSGSFVVLQVVDNGCGIPREHQVRVFHPFYTTKAAGRGTGLGLSSVLRVTQTHGGWVELESAPGRGTCFSLFFPVAEQPCRWELASRSR